MIIKQFYVTGSDGYRNLFRKDNKFIIQWEGSPEHDSGYHSRAFSNLEEALLKFDELNERNL
jgi:hypothetical protein